MPESNSPEFLASLLALAEAPEASARFATVLVDRLAQSDERIAALSRGLDALTEQVGDTTQYATLGDVDSLRAEMLSRTATPFDNA